MNVEMVLRLRLNREEKGLKGGGEEARNAGSRRTGMPGTSGERGPFPNALPKIRNPASSFGLRRDKSEIRNSKSFS
jgi:hypothetical protein